METGLYYPQSRYYDPEIGRFVTIDDIAYLAPDTVNGLNLYAYCGNNPVMGYDFNGNWDWGNFAKILGAVGVIVAITALTVATAGGAAYSTVLQLYQLDHGLNFEKNGLAIMSGILFVKNAWRNKSLFL